MVVQLLKLEGKGFDGSRDMYAGLKRHEKKGIPNAIV
jgi:hypothetical protein